MSRALPTPHLTSEMRFRQGMGESCIYSDKIAKHTTHRCKARVVLVPKNEAYLMPTDAQ